MGYLKHKMIKEKPLSLQEELVRIWNETPYMENPTRTELADKINDKFALAVKRLKKATEGAISRVPIDKIIDEILGDFDGNK